MKPFLRTFLFVASLFVLCACVFSFAGDNDSHTGDSHGSDSHGSAFRGREFNGVVHAIEDHYGVRHTHIPFLSLAMLFARPAGVSGFKLAVFEDLHSSDVASMNDDPQRDDLQHVVEHSLSSDWHLFVRTRSRDDGDNTLIYVNLGDGKMQMMVVAIEPNEATVVEMNLSERALRKWIDEPKASAKDQSGHHRHLAED